MATDIQTAADYAAYESSVAAFMQRNRLHNLSAGYVDCPECGASDFWQVEQCACGADREAWSEASFSWYACDCCGGTLGGDREHCTGAADNGQGGVEVLTFESVCSDCVYYAEYGQLDDSTMLRIDPDSNWD
jgi:hypothetical protein